MGNKSIAFATDAVDDVAGQDLNFATNTTIKPGGRWIALGDSTSTGYGMSPGEDWISVLMTLPSFVGRLTKYNFAVNAATTLDAINQYNTSAHPLRPTGTEQVHVSMFVGTNPVSSGQTGLLAAADYATLCGLAKADGCIVWAFTMMDRGDLNGATRAEMHEFNAAVRRATYWDYLVETALLFPSYLDTPVFTDTVHPNAVGEQMIAHLINHMATGAYYPAYFSSQRLATKDVLAQTLRADSSVTSAGSVSAATTVSAGTRVTVGTSETNAALVVGSSAAASYGQLLLRSTAAGVDFVGQTFYPRASGANASSRSWFIGCNYVNFGEFTGVISASATTSPTTQVFTWDSAGVFHQLFGALITGGVAIASSAPSLNTSAILQADSTTQGFLPPRMTSTQRDAIGSPAEGLIIYNTTTHKLNVRVAAAWEAITSA